MMKKIILILGIATILGQVNAQLVIPGYGGSSYSTNIGSGNTGWSHFQTNAPRFYFNKPITSHSGHFGAYASSNLIFATGVSGFSGFGATRMTILKSNGNVGIGTTTPSSKLEVSGKAMNLSVLKLSNKEWKCNQTTAIEFWNGNNKNYATSRIVSKMDGCGTHGEALLFETQTAGATGPSTKMTIKNNGNVGIGTIAPGAKLHIQTNASTALKFSRPGANTFGFEIGSTDFGLVDYTNNEYKWRTNNGNVLLAEKSGNVGIGTAAPKTKLDVNGEIASTVGNSIAQFRAVGGSYGLMLRNDGTNSYFLLTNKNDAFGNWNSFRPMMINNSTGDFYVHDGAAIYARASDKKVGIGTTTPTAKLEVHTHLPSTGTYNTQTWSTSNPLYNLKLQTVWSSNGIQHNFIEKFDGADYNSLSFFSGNVGIGTTAPTAPLDVNGTIRSFRTATSPAGNLGLEIKTAGAFVNACIGFKPENDRSDLVFYNRANAVSAKLFVHTLPAGSELSFYDYSAGSANRIFRVTKEVTDVSKRLNVLASTNSSDIAFSVKNLLNLDRQDVFRVMADGHVWCTELDIKLREDFPDYVFDKEYALMPLDELENYIVKNKHLPNIPSAKEVAKDGLSVGEMQVKQMEKIEELTLYLLDMKKELDLIKNENVELKQLIQQK